jgi:hypothetical protein
MSRTTFQSEYKNVCIEMNHQMGMAYLKVSTKLERFGDWFTTAQTLESCKLSDDAAIDRLKTRVLSICPIFHGSARAVAQYQMPSTGAF